MDTIKHSQGLPNLKLPDITGIKIAEAAFWEMTHSQHTVPIQKSKRSQTVTILSLLLWLMFRQAHIFFQDVSFPRRSESAELK